MGVRRPWRSERWEMGRLRRNWARGKVAIRRPEVWEMRAASAAVTGSDELWGVEEVDGSVGGRTERTRWKMYGRRQTLERGSLRRQRARRRSWGLLGRSDHLTSGLGGGPGSSRAAGVLGAL